MRAINSQEKAGCQAQAREVLGGLVGPRGRPSLSLGPVEPTAGWPDSAADSALLGSGPALVHGGVLCFFSKKLQCCYLFVCLLGPPKQQANCASGSKQSP